MSEAHALLLPLHPLALARGNGGSMGLASSSGPDPRIASSDPPRRPKADQRGGGGGASVRPAFLIEFVSGPPPAPPWQEGSPNFLKVKIGRGGDENGPPPAKVGSGVVAHESRMVNTNAPTDPYHPELHGTSSPYLHIPPKK